MTLSVTAPHLGKIQANLAKYKLTFINIFKCIIIDLASFWARLTGKNYGTSNFKAFHVMSHETYILQREMRLSHKGPLTGQDVTSLR